MNSSIQIDAGQWGKIGINFSDEARGSTMIVPHIHDGWEIFCWLGGRMVYYLDEQPLMVPHSAVVPVPPGMGHRTQYDEHELRWKVDLNFEEKFFNIFPTKAAGDQIRASLMQGMVTVSMKWANELRQLVVDMVLDAEEGEMAAAKAVFALASILAGIAQAAGEHQETEKVGMRHTHVARAMAIIDREYVHSITLPALSERLHLTKSYLCHIFQEVQGMTVTEYIRFCRVRAAKELLLDAGLSIAEIAERVGFGCVNYFTKCFREEEGATPSYYRTIVLGKK